MSAASCLPLCEADALPGEAALSGPEPGGRTEPQSILVVGAGLFGETIAEVLSALEMQGVWRGDEIETAAAIAEHQPSLVFVEVSHWSEARADHCRRLALSGIPVIVLLEFGDSAARARALEAGAEDCVSAPCAPSELAARVRRALYPATATSPVFGEWRLDLLSREVIGADRRRISLGPAELSVLRRLLADRGRVTPVETLALAASGGPSGRPLSLNHLRVLLHRLRAKLGRDSRGSQAIVCVRHRGYTLSPAAQSSGSQLRAGREEASLVAVPASGPQLPDTADTSPALKLVADVALGARSVLPQAVQRPFSSSDKCPMIA